MPVNNLPLPYQDELLFSVLARAKVHLCIRSPKGLLKTVYGHSGMIASTRFGSNLGALANSYDYCGLSPQILLYKHTLWPLIAPFIPHERKLRCELWLIEQRDKAVTVTSGVAASRLKYPKHLRYCPLCVREQIAESGETYWQRLHQVPGIDICLKHECSLNVYKSANLQRHQHEFFPLLSTDDTTIGPSTIQPFFCELHDYVVTLLNLDIFRNPSYEQWSAYFRALAIRLGFNRGKQVEHEEIKSLVTNQFSNEWLKSIGLAVDSADKNWSRAIFRKHRKSFSFMEHFIINCSLMPCPWDVEETLKEVSRYNKIRYVKPSGPDVPHSESVLQKYRKKWLGIVALKGAKQARTINGAAYAWLYKYDKFWLLSINADYRVKTISEYHKVDWHKRDYCYARKVLKVINETELDLANPQRTKTWLLSHFENKSSLEKWLTKLPITNKLLQKYAETTPEYQIRRVTRTLIYGDNRKARQVWFLMRASGLSKERLTAAARQFIEMLLDHSIIYGSSTSIDGNQQNAD